MILMTVSLLTDEELKPGGTGCSELDESTTGAMEDDDASAIGGAAGLGASSPEQPTKRVIKPVKPRERIFFFMITKYSLQKCIALAKTFLLSLESL